MIRHINKKVESNSFYLVNMLTNTSELLISSFATIYLLQSGISYAQLGLVFAMFLVSSALFEYPSGALADKYGRRKLYLIGIILTALSYFILLFNEYYVLVCISYMIKGLGAALISGTLEAWLSHEVDKNEFKTIISKNSLYQSFINIILPISFVFITIPNLKYVFVLCMVLYCCAACVCHYFMKENYGSNDKIFNLSKEALKLVVTNRELIISACMNIAVYLFFTIFLFIWQPISKLQIDTSFLPVIYGVYLFAKGISSYLFKNINESKYRYMFLYASWHCF